MTDRLPPYSEEAERGVLGSLLADDQMQRVASLCVGQGVEPSWFYTPAHRLVYETIIELHMEEKAVDLITLGERLKQRGILEQVGGYGFLDRLIDDTPTATHAEYYLEIVRQKHQLRSIISHAGDTIERCYKGTPPEELMEAMGQFASGFERDDGEKEISEAIDDNITVLENAFNGITSGLPLPFEKLSLVTGGAQRGSMIPLVGRDGRGKSGCLAQWLDCWVGLGIPTLAFSLEDSKRRVLLRMGGNRENYSARTVETGRRLLMGQWQKICDYEKTELIEKMNRYRDFLAGKPFWILDKPRTVENIIDRIRFFHRKHGLHAVTIDGFKDIVPSTGKTENEKQNHISKKLAGIAKELDIALVVVNHIRKTRDDLPISKLDIIGASAQFQGARQVFIFQDAGVDGVDGETTFALDACKSNYTGGGMSLLRRDESVLTYTEV